ncbi:MAG: DNA-binding domain-containing protein [Hyphomicrobiaceae bacterium]
MPRLTELQSDFATALLTPDAPPPAGVHGPTATLPVKRYNVYRNNLVASLIQVLEARYPVVLRLVGEDFFRGLGRLYVEAHLPRSPILAEFGGELAAFLASFEPARGLPYLPDVARLEWLQHVAYHAADALPLAPGDLASVAAATIPKLRFTLHPSVGIVASTYPIVSIWETNRRDETVSPIRLDQGAETALVVRPALEVETRKAPTGTDIFIDALGRGVTLAEAATDARTRNDHFNVQLALATVIEAGALIGYRA